MIRRTLLAACVAVLATTPAWAHPGRGHGAGRDGRPAPHRPAQSKSHRCTPHAVAYVAAGLLVGHTLVLDGEDGGGEPAPTATASRADRPTYSGEVTIDVKRTNRHARADAGTTKTYVLDHARVLVAQGDVANAVPGSRAKVIGKVTKLAPRCDQEGFTPELKIRKLLVHAPKAPAS
jgi:hypothetical protein